MRDLLQGVPWGELTAYIILIVLCLWVVKSVVAALIHGEIVPAKQVEVWQGIAETEQVTSKKLVAQNERLFEAVKALQHLVESTLPRGRDEQHD